MLLGESKRERLAAGFLSSVKKLLKERVRGIDGERERINYSLNSFSLPSLSIKRFSDKEEENKSVIERCIPRSGKKIKREH